MRSLHSVVRVASLLPLRSPLAFQSTVVGANSVLLPTCTQISQYGSLAHSSPRAPPPEQSKRPGKDISDPSHTSKWLSEGIKSPMEMIAEVPPIAVHQRTAVCHGGDDVSLGHPVEYITLDDTNEHAPNTCKYCGLRFYQVGGH
eukprot:CAMPEP_0196572984 /NCGR_PEP_ID=MMETSP1081-20130531/2951_1 /TAXON_ID=36882 /ORGANISM="Pyramimonas amylifera, Strain CCMP720" /LENGTH=143 /DNA_ID=CAMNT_0041890519 /DNA_START=92 /DNA_END=523 /DNA_ORIENTATION=+